MERLSVLFHHYVIASHWAGMQGSCEDLADEWVGVHLDCDLRYGTNDSDLRACYVSGMAKMIGAKRKMQLDALLLEFDAEREEFGDFFCREHCARYNRSPNEGGCKMADYHRRARRGEKVTRREIEWGY